MSIETLTSNSANGQDDFAWGADSIGRVINRSPRQTHYLLQKGSIKSAKKVNDHWVANVPALRKEFGA